jgi:hypothetical protein
MGILGAVYGMLVLSGMYAVILFAGYQHWWGQMLMQQEVVYLVIAIGFILGVFPSSSSEEESENKITVKLED